MGRMSRRDTCDLEDNGVKTIVAKYNMEPMAWGLGYDCRSRSEHSSLKRASVPISFQSAFRPRENTLEAQRLRFF